MSFLWTVIELEQVLLNCDLDDIDYFFDGQHNLHPTILSLSYSRSQLEVMIGEIRWLPKNNYSSRLLLEARRVLAHYDDFFRQAKRELPWLPDESAPMVVDALSKLRRARTSKELSTRN